MVIVPFAPEHLQQIELQAAQEYFNQMIDIAYAMQIEKHPSFTALDGNTVIACGGIIRPWPGRCCAWALLSKHAGRHFVVLHRTVKRYFDLCEDRRIEALADADFAEAHRWLEMLGFEREGRLRIYTPDGRDVDMYARVKNG